MSEPVIAYGIASVFLFAYLILSSIEFGAALYMLLPERVLERATIRTYVNPIWETTNIFLIFFIMTLFTCFPRAEVALSPLLYPIASAALIFFVLRIIGILGLFYGDMNAFAWRVLFWAGSWGAALILSGTYFVLLTGESAFGMTHTVLGFSLVALVVTTIMLLSSTFFLKFTRKRRRLHPQLVRVAYGATIAWFASVALYIMGLSVSADYVFASLTPFVLGGYLALICAVFLVPVLVHSRAYTSAFVTACVCLGLVFFGSAYRHLPYLLYPTHTVSASFTSAAVFQGILAGGAVGALFLVPALFLLYWLFASA